VLLGSCAYRDKKVVGVFVRFFVRHFLQGAFGVKHCMMGMKI
jgi:hypothetical protein